MRTTLTLDDDVASRLKQLAHRKQISFKEAVNGAIRQGLSAQQAPQRPRKGFKLRTYRSGFLAGVDPFRLNQISDELETQRFVEKAGRDHPRH